MKSKNTSEEYLTPNSGFESSTTRESSYNTNLSSHDYSTEETTPILNPATMNISPL